MISRLSFFAALFLATAAAEPRFVLLTFTNSMASADLDEPLEAPSIMRLDTTTGRSWIYFCVASTNGLDPFWIEVNEGNAAVREALKSARTVKAWVSTNAPGAVLQTPAGPQEVSAETLSKYKAQAEAEILRIERKLTPREAPTP